MAKPVGIKFDEVIASKDLKVLGERCECSPHWLIKKAICEFLDRMEAEETEKHILLNRWNRYQETGESISHEKIKSWLNMWGIEKERACPTKHNCFGSMGRLKTSPKSENLSNRTIKNPH